MQTTHKGGVWKTVLLKKSSTRHIDQKLGMSLQSDITIEYFFVMPLYIMCQKNDSIVKTAYNLYIMLSAFCKLHGVINPHYLRCEKNLFS